MRYWEDKEFKKLNKEASKILNKHINNGWLWFWESWKYNRLLRKLSKLRKE